MHLIVPPGVAIDTPPSRVDHLVQPGLPAARGAHLEPGCVALSVLPQLPHAQPGREVDLVGMANEPPFETARRHLSMALEGKAPRAPGKGLVFVGRGRGQVGGTRRQIEGIAVPMQDSGLALRQLRQAGPSAQPR